MASDDLITLARAQLNPALASVSASYLAVLISTASAQLQIYARRCFVSQDFTANFDGEGDQTLFIKNYPITNIKQVDFIDPDGVVNVVMASGGDYTKYFFIGDGGEIDFIVNNPSDYSRFPKGFKNIKITYTGGYTTIPEDIQEACAEQIVFINDQGSANSSIKSEKLGDFSQSFFDQGNSGGSNTLSKTAFQLLSPYRDMGF